MSSSRTIRFIIKTTERGAITTPMEWKTKQNGRPNDANLAKWIDGYINAFKLGGVNQHVSIKLGFIPIPNSAVVIDQMTGETKATWKAPMFMAI